ncbi:bifunctional metallophosphatase/5'-nucleotidase [Salinithrix halophila]|uniref:Bifunctional metallophosphatase/5'-nucleotidase n=1 Tax=Salinithrix halophila TaxID=1485204 RepID=A0ABV8JC75_9BACL
MNRTLIHILHTNDIHSHFEEMPRIQTVLDGLRRELSKTDAVCFTVDVGDHMDRVRVETEGTRGRANRAVMETAGYQMITLGNNELLTFSKPDLDALFTDAPFEVLAANVEEAKGEQPHWLRRWTVREAEGFRIGFLGVTIPFQNFYRLLGWNVSDPLSLLAQEVARLRQEVDAVILLSHLGLGNDRRLAEAVPGIDVILGSHTHHLLEVPERVGPTLIAAAGKFGGHVGHVTLEMDPVTRRVAALSGRCLPVREAPADEKVREQIRRFRLEAKNTLSEPILELSEPLPVDWHRESPLGNLLADGLLDWVGADCSLVNAGQLLGGLKAGPVSRGRLHEICPHPINPCRILLSGASIRCTLEESLLQEYQDKGIRGFGFRGKQLGTINMAGIKAVFEPAAPPMEKLREVRVAGAPLEEDELYRVATIDMFTFGVGYTEIKKGKEIEYFLPEFLRDILAHQLHRPGALRQCWIPRWQLQERDTAL